MASRLLIAVLFTVLAVCTGCAALVAGAGAGAGVYTYVSGDLKRTYNVPFEKAVTDSRHALQSLKIKISSEHSSGITTTIHAAKSDKTPVTVTITILGPNITEVAVRTGVVGLWDKKVSELIHAHIAQRLFRKNG